MPQSSILEKSAFVEIQGPRVLDVLDRNNDYIHYQVVGFRSPRLFIIDHREKVNQEFDRCLEVNDFNHFAYSFSSPARVVLQRDKIGDLTLLLYDSITQIPGYIAWIAVGLEEEVPEYPYVFQEVQKENKNAFSVMTIYPLDRPTMMDFMDVDASTCVSI